MNTDKSGGAAFPRSDGGYSETLDGMSLRDYFAAKAITGMADISNSPNKTAQWAYQLADAMIEERNK